MFFVRKIPFYLLTELTKICFRRFENSGGFVEKCHRHTNKKRTKRQCYQLNSNTAKFKMAAFRRSVYSNAFFSSQNTNLRFEIKDDRCIYL